MKNKVLNSKFIIKKIEENKYNIHKYSVKKIGLFGSYLKNNPNKRSDIDFIVRLDKPTFDNYMELKFLLEKMFHKKIDLVTEESLKPALKYIKEDALYAKI